MKYIFAVDLGGTTVKMGLFNESGEVLEKWEIVTVKDNNGAQILPDIAESIKKKAAEKNLSKEDVLGVGIGAPGPIDSKGNIFGAPNLGWGNFNVSDTLSGLTGYTVKQVTTPMLPHLARCGWAAEKDTIPSLWLHSVQV